MKIILSILAVVLLSLAAQAEDTEATATDEYAGYFDTFVRPNRKSYVGLTFGGGDFAYSYSGINGGIGIGKSWRINIAGTTYKNEQDASTRDFRVGADYLITDAISARANIITKNEPNDIRGLGGNIGADWVISDLWKGDWQSIIFMDLESVTYQQYKGTRGNIPDGERLKQSMILIGTSQELWHSFMITLTITAYGYEGKDPDLWASEVAERRAAPDGSYGLIKGFQKSSSSLQIQWFATDWLTLDVAGSTVYSTLKQTTRVSSLGANIFWRPHWSFDINASSSATDGQRDGGVIGGGVKYTF
jgi:hypothetical protein